MNRTNRPLWPYEPQVMTDDEQEAAHAAHVARWGRPVDEPPSASAAATWAWWLPVAIPAGGVIALALAAVYWDELHRLVRGWL